MRDKAIGKALVIILDGVGCGALPDAKMYGDADANTLSNMADAVGGLKLPNLQKMGLGNIIDIAGVHPVDNPAACYGKMAEFSPAKDSTVGHWELMGHPVEKPLPTYPNGFPEEIVEALRGYTGREFIGNIPASGTEIIAQLGGEHLRTEALILYTSADSVLQIAAHEEIVAIEDLYRICRIAREIMAGEHAVGRIIARPFIGKPGSFRRTVRRHDFSLQPPGDTILDILLEKGIPTISIGKISDLFGGKGISESNPTESNTEGIEATIKIAGERKEGLIFTNLVDFDMLWGHRNDPQGFYDGLREFDESLPVILHTICAADLLMITADHGVDPTTVSTDHSREYAPILAYSPKLDRGWDLGVRKTFADVSATIAEFFKVEGTGWGDSFLSLLGYDMGKTGHSAHEG